MTYIHKTYHSQFGEDKWLVENLSLPYHGVFVDVGAGDPIRFSNSYYFEKNGWFGVCVDADPRQIEKLKIYRKNVEHCAVANEKGITGFKLADHPDLTHRDSEGEYKVKMRTLEDILKQYNVRKIDLLSIDVEGGEIEVMQSFDWFRHKPEIIIIEFLAITKDNSEKILELFKGTPYKQVHKTTSNFIFKLEK